MVRLYLEDESGEKDEDKFVDVRLMSIVKAVFYGELVIAGIVFLGMIALGVLSILFGF